MTGEASVPARDLAAAHRRAVELAESAGRLQVQRRSSVVVQGTKAHANDLVSDVDHASEALIVDGLRAAWPDDGVLAEPFASLHAPATVRSSSASMPLLRNDMEPPETLGEMRRLWCPADRESHCWVGRWGDVAPRPD